MQNSQYNIYNIDNIKSDTESLFPYWLQNSESYESFLYYARLLDILEYDISYYTDLLPEDIKQLKLMKINLTNM